MFKNLSKLLVRFPLQIFFVIGFITVFFFWLAFVSENRLQVDFSLEQMFPEGDPQKEIYDLFTQEFQREDDKLLLVYDCYRPTSRENIVELAEITEMLELDVSGIENVLSLSNIDDGEYFHEDLSDEDSGLLNRSILLSLSAPRELISEEVIFLGLLLTACSGIAALEGRLP